MRILEKGREWGLPGLLYADDLVLCGESKEELRVMVGWFVEVCRRRGMKVIGEERLACEVHVDGICLEYISEFKYLGCFERIRYR